MKLEISEDQQKLLLEIIEACHFKGSDVCKIYDLIEVIQRAGLGG